MKSRCLTLLVTAILATTAPAAVKLPALISDNMVLQQNLPANVWGWADPGEKVIVKLGAKSAETTASDKGRWSVKLADLPPGEAGEMTVAGSNTLAVKNVAVGEVWVCSGQSNMEWTVRASMNATEEISGANFPLIRHFAVDRTPSAEPREDCKGRWEICSPQTAGNFTAVGYSFARQLFQKLKVPVGLIHSSWGGTKAELWTPWPILQADPDFKSITTTWEKTLKDYPAAKEKYDSDMEAWRETEKIAKEAGEKLPAQPRLPSGGNPNGSPSSLFNGMIAPLLPYTIRGVTWYQGESNASSYTLYRKLFPTMIQSWREAWQLPEFPFLFVQLANYMQRHDEPTDTQWARLREAQTQALALPHTGMAVAIDVGDAKDIHPKDKQTVGQRLALVAEATVYYRDVEHSGPMFGGAQIEGEKIRLTLRSAEGLKTTDGGKIKGFAIAGDDRKFVWADAIIAGDHVIVSSLEIKAPAAVRYAWADNPECNLINAAGLPAAPFRTDEWPIGPAPVKAVHQ